MVATQYTHMALDSCKENMVDHSKDRKLGYCVCHSLLPLLFKIEYYTVFKCAKANKILFNGSFKSEGNYLLM